MSEKPKNINVVSEEFLNKAKNLVTLFELVLDQDWEMTKSCLNDELFLSKDGTFLNPKVEDESNNWANRGSLLASYREFKEILDKYDMDDSFE